MGAQGVFGVVWRRVSSLLDFGRTGIRTDSERERSVGLLGGGRQAAETAWAVVGRGRIADMVSGPGRNSGRCAGEPDSAAQSSRDRSSRRRSISQGRFLRQS